MSNNPALRVGGLKPRRNVFDLSYRTNFTCDMGQLIPVYTEEVVPGDYFKIGAEMVIRFQPLAAPVMHEITAHIHYFFMPKRLEYGTTNEEKNLWEQFISQGDLMDDNLPIQLPTFDRYKTELAVRDLGTLWDYFGFPVTREQVHDINMLPDVLDTLWRVYNRIYNEYYRDQDLQSEVGDGVIKYPDGHPNAGQVIPLNPYVLNRNWAKDYFTASRPWRQKGTAPALPVDVNFKVEGIDFAALRLFDSQQGLNPSQPITTAQQTISDGMYQGLSLQNLSVGGQNGLRFVAANQRPAGSNLGVSPSDLTNNMSASTTTFDVSDLRLAFQTQKWLERNARAGTRYTEFLRSHFGVAPSDARLDRPEYIGGVKMPVRISEVLQTSETSQSSQLAQMGGHGLAADGQYVGDYNVQEYGTIMGILSVMPKPAYQQGINRKWLRRLPTDFYFPEFARLSEQAIYTGELYIDWGRSDPYVPFGFTGQYDEMRVNRDVVCSEMRRINDPAMEEHKNPLLSYWNMARFFESKPLLNSQFITCNPDSRKDIFLVRTKPGLIVNVQNNVRAVRPLPQIADPGFIDHY